ncbi:MULTISPECIES: hypothetical protein [Streptomyces]|uniref:Aromatic ring-opening dioxygenase LigA n=2 Tax=Streptomyces TaxID=1883 RepID=A0A117IUS5_9ACTN|nr:MULTISPECIES: hypothetical protein [Streptomyces]KUH35512.1 hypothetical protein ATE80_28775 [Streptomyces kanasensis]UUS31507.1 hypothetical protein NRO40_12130 [Streptomyces changanensis]
MSKDSSKDQAAPSGRRRGVRPVALASAAAVVLAGGAFWLSGGYDAWRGTDDALAGACDGHLADGPVRQLLPGVALTASAALQHDGWRCALTAADTTGNGGTRFEVRVRDAQEPFGPDGAVDPGDGAVPLGGGWTGSFAYGAPDEGGPARGRVVVLLDCGDETGDGLLAAADARLGSGTGFRDAGARARLATALTDTALSYARRTGCDAADPGPVRDVAAPAAADVRVPLGRASGTCAGVVDAATGRRWGAGTAAETAAEPAPVEHCTLGSVSGTPLYAFTASYGPYGEAVLSGGDALPALGKANAPEGHYRMTARCPGADGTAVYEIVPDDGLALDHVSLRTALKSFATASAERHACDAPS